MAQFNVAEAKARFSELVQKAVSGEEVVIARDNRPLLRLVPLGATSGPPDAGLGQGADLDGPRLRPDAGGLRGLRPVRLLLDTHAFLWWVGATRGLSRKARSAVGSGRNECFVSIASGWEIAIKVSLGTLRVEGALDRFLPEQLAANGFQPLPIDLKHCGPGGDAPLPPPRPVRPPARGPGPRGGARDRDGGPRVHEVRREAGMVIPPP